MARGDGAGLAGDGNGDAARGRVFSLPVTGLPGPPSPGRPVPPGGTAPGRSRAAGHAGRGSHRRLRGAIAAHGPASWRVLADDAPTALAAGGGLVAAGGTAGTAWVLEAASGLPVATLSLPGGIADLAFSPDGSHLLITARGYALWHADDNRATVLASGRYSARARWAGPRQAAVADGRVAVAVAVDPVSRQLWRTAQPPARWPTWRGCPAEGSPSPAIARSAGTSPARLSPRPASPFRRLSHDHGLGRRALDLRRRPRHGHRPGLAARQRRCPRHGGRRGNHRAVESARREARTPQNHHRRVEPGRRHHRHRLERARHAPRRHPQRHPARPRSRPALTRARHRGDRRLTASMRTTHRPGQTRRTGRSGSPERFSAASLVVINKCDRLPADGSTPRRCSTSPAPRTRPASRRSRRPRGRPARAASISTPPPGAGDRCRRLHHRYDESACTPRAGLTPVSRQ